MWRDSARSLTTAQLRVKFEEKYPNFKIYWACASSSSSSSSSSPSVQERSLSSVKNEKAKVMRDFQQAQRKLHDLTQALEASEEKNRRLQAKNLLLRGGPLRVLFSLSQKNSPLSLFSSKNSPGDTYSLLNNKHNSDHSPKPNITTLYQSTEPPRFTFDVFHAVKTLINTYTQQHLDSISDAEVHTFMGALHRETSVIGGVAEIISEVGTIAVRLWTSPQTLQNRELCSIFNEAIRKDDKAMMPAVVLFAKSLNMLCVTRRLSSEVRLPEKTFRGGALPQEHHSFFKVGKQFRTPQFLSTSRTRQVAFDFTHKVASRGEEPVLWEFVFQRDFGCKHVNFLQHSNVEGKDEFLFTVYSVFSFD